jgi:UDP-N-acetylmuramoylalanine--D-glutamate ligase
MKLELGGKTMVVVGAGATGFALSRYLRGRHAEVILSDRSPADKVEGLATLTELGIRLDLGGHTPELFENADLIVISPGVPLTNPCLQAALTRGVPVMGEIELAFQELNVPVVAVAGTNGKSTTTSLIGEIFKAWGRRTFVGGNLGTPLIEAVQIGQWELAVAEVSSFQLEAIQTFRPRYAILLNISEDHLDRYAGMDEYVAAKANLFVNMTDRDTAVLNADDSRVMALAGTVRARKVFFSSSGELAEGMSLSGDALVWRQGAAEKAFLIHDLRLKGLHNLENIMAALIPALLEGCPPDLAWQAVCDFPGLEHRMNLVRRLGGVNWYNDSKGTNVGSVVKSLAGLPAPVTLIAGGRDKGGDYSPLRGLVKAKVAHLLLIGQAAERLCEALGDLTDTRILATLEEAVRTAFDITAAGGSVLFSPACSSFDMFSNFEERGRIFSQLVLALPEEAAVENHGTA